MMNTINHSFKGLVQGCQNQKGVRIDIKHEIKKKVLCKRYHIGVARVQEGRLRCSAGHGKSLCLGFFDFKNFLLVSKLKLFKLLIIFVKNYTLGKEVFKKKPFVWSYSHPRDFLRGAIMLFSRPEIVMEEPCITENLLSCGSNTQVRMRDSLVVCAKSCIC